MKKRVLVLGGTGYIGTTVTEELMGKNFTPIIFTRKNSEKKLPESVIKKSIIVEGDLSNIRTVGNILLQHKPFGIIYLIGLSKQNKNRGVTFQKFHYKFPTEIFELAQKTGIRKCIFVSANGVKEYGTEYQTTKFKTEEFLKLSTLNWTIIRPSIVIGNSDQYHFTKVVQGLIKFRVIPVLGTGKYRLAPVYRGDIAKIIVCSLTHPNAHNEIFQICGDTIYSYNELLKITAEAMRKRIILLHIPIVLAKPIVYFCQKLPLFPITFDQLTMLVEENICDKSRVWQALSITPTPVDKIITDEYSKN